MSAFNTINSAAGKIAEHMESAESISKSAEVMASANDGKTERKL